MKRKIIYSSIFFVLACVLLITLFFSSSLESLLYLSPDLSMIGETAFEVHFIDVGQGDAVAVRFPNEKTMLVDSGPVSGKDNLIEYLDNVFFEDGYNTFDYVFLTHSDIDHSGNMNYILNNYKVNNFYRPYIFSENLESESSGFKDNNICYDEILTTLNNKAITTFFCSDGGVINVGDSKIEIFAYSKLTELDEANEFSPTLIITANDSKVCLSGDAGIDIEKDLIDRNLLPEVDLFKLSHHGSKYSNSLDFINTLSPKYVVCSVGENSYGHPASDVLLRLAEFDELSGNNTYSTFKSTLNNGNVIYYVNSNEMSVVEINSLGDYIFLDWYIIVIIGEIVIIACCLLIVIPKKRIRINPHMKNMKA